MLPAAPATRAANRSSRSSAAAGELPSSRCAASDAAQLTHDGRGRRPVADDVAHDERHRRVADLEHVVPVAAGERVLRRRGVAGGAGEPGQRGQAGREQAALQDLGDLVLGLVQPGPVERLRALARRGDERAALVVVELGRAVGEPQADGPDHPVGQRQRHGERGGRPLRIAGAHRAGERVVARGRAGQRTAGAVAAPPVRAGRPGAGRPRSRPRRSSGPARA